MMLVQMAFRNLKRNIRRSIITASAVSVGMSVLVLSNTLRAGQYDEMIHSSVSQLAGHVVIQHPEYQEEQETELVVEQQQEWVTAIQQVLPDATITSRTRLGGILASSSGPTVAGLNAVDPVAEARVSEMDEMLVAGTWLEDDVRSIVIGKNMAEILNVEVGDKLVFTTSVEGEMNSHLYRLSGIFQSGAEEIDAFVGYVSLSSVGDLLGQPNTANQIAVHLENARDTEKSVKLVEEAVLPKISSSADSVSILPWQKVLPDVIAMIKVDQVSNEIIAVSLMFIVAMGILNTMLMNVLERTREFGVLMAIGLKRGALGRLILLEAAILGVIGGILGAILGLIISYPLVANGLDLSSMMGGGMAINGAVSSTILYGRYDPYWISLYVALSILCSVLSALYPAWKIQQLTPVDAMRG